MNEAEFVKRTGTLFRLQCIRTPSIFLSLLLFVAGSYDFFGINHYSSIYVTSGSDSESGVSTVSSTVSSYLLYLIIIIKLKPAFYSRQS